MSFSFNGVSAENMGLYVLPYTRPFKAEQRVVQTYVQGRSGTYDYTDESFANGVISIPCVYFGSTAPETIRQIATWLHGTGTLIFDDNPDVYYKASLWTNIDLSEMLFEKQLTLEFTVYPFAFSQNQQVTATLATSGNSLTVQVGGTAPTPCRIIITNNGQNTLTNLMVMRSSIV